MKCIFCGGENVEKKFGVFHFDVSDLDDGYPTCVDIPNSVWSECHDCGEILMDKKINKEIGKWQYQRQGMLAPEEFCELRRGRYMTLVELSKATRIKVDRLDRYELGLIIPKKEEADKIREILEKDAG